MRGINPDGSIADGLGIRDPAQRAFLETFFDRAFEDLLDTFAMTFAFAESLGREALQLLNFPEFGAHR